MNTPLIKATIHVKEGRVHVAGIINNTPKIPLDMKGKYFRLYQSKFYSSLAINWDALFLREGVIELGAFPVPASRGGPVVFATKLAEELKHLNQLAEEGVI